MEAQFATPIICPVLIGRAHDLTTLRLLVDRAKSGQGHVALVCGEAGIGKSRLVAEVKTSAASHDFLLLQGNCFPTDHAIPYAPLLDLLRSFFASHSSALPTTEVKQVARAFLSLLPDMGHVLLDGTSPSMLAALDPEQEKRRRFETLTHFLTSQARARPMLLVMEDLHWSDDTSLEFLHYLARRCAAHRLLLLLTYRSDEVRPGLRISWRNWTGNGSPRKSSSPASREMRSMQCCVRSSRSPAQCVWSLLSLCMHSRRAILSSLKKRSSH